MAVDERWIAWLAGFIEGEGYLEMQMNKRTGARVKQHGIGPRLGICNSDLLLLDKCQAILRDIGVEAGRHKTARGNKFAKRECFALRVTNRTDLVVVLTAIMPYLLRLKPKAEKILEWLAMRSARIGYNAPYNAAEMALANEIRAMPSSGNVIQLVV